MPNELTPAEIEALDAKQGQEDALMEAIAIALGQKMKPSEIIHIMVGSFEHAMDEHGAFDYPIAFDAVSDSIRILAVVAKNLEKRGQ